jgi:glyoxylase-like metal-dependent hydrolase (beta-lactamase superfamily II)
VSLYFKKEDVLIAGDVLFRESIGRTDLYRGNFELLATSIREKLYPLPDRTVVYPGHGPETTIGHEKKKNPFVPAT